MKIRTRIKKHLWTVGLLSLITGGFLTAFPIFAKFANLSPYYFGFFISGLAIMNFGTLSALFSLWAPKKNNKIKIRLVLIVASSIHMLLIGYIFWRQVMHMPEFEWLVGALIIGNWAIFDTFVFSQYNVLLTTLYSFGIFVLTYTIDELGIFINYSDELPDPNVEGFMEK